MSSLAAAVARFARIDCAAPASLAALPVAVVVWIAAALMRRRTLARQQMKQPDRTIEVAPSTETESRRREVQLLINIAEPDPEYQPFIVTDEASLLDAVATDASDIERRLTAYFGHSLGLDLRAPIWRVVEAIKRIRPGWPDEPGSN